MLGLRRAVQRALCSSAAATTTTTAAPTPVSGSVVGFSATRNHPFVQLSGGGPRIEATPHSEAQKKALFFRQSVQVQQDPETGAWDILPTSAEETGASAATTEARLQPLSEREARRYQQVTRGPNAVGTYAYVSRRMRAGQEKRSYPAGRPQ